MYKSVQDELKHHGILGMKWGVRRKPGANGTVGDSAKARIKETARTIKNQTLHPIKSMVSTYSSLANDKPGTQFRRGLAYQKTSELKDINDRVDQMIKASKEKKTANRNKAQSLAAQKKQVKNDKAKAKIQKDIDSFDPFLKTGITDKSGKMLLTSEDVKGMVAALEETKKKFSN